MGNSESVLWLEFKSGNIEALQQIYNNNIPILESYASKFTADKELMYDVIHDLFIYIWEKRNNISDTDSISKYLCVALRNMLVKRINKERQTISYEEKVNTSDVDFDISIEDLLILEESNSTKVYKLHKAISNLPKRQKEAIYLKYSQDRTYEEICDIMGIHYQSVRNLISAALIELREKLLFIFIIMSTNAHIVSYT